MTTSDHPSQETPGIEQRAVQFEQRWGGSGTSGAMLAAFAREEIARITAAIEAPRSLQENGGNWREIIKQLDDRPLPTYGQIPWKQLGRDVVDVIYATRRDYEFDPTYYEGHQMVPQINFNSLARIVDKYRYYGLPCSAVSPPEPVAWEHRISGPFGDDGPLIAYYEGNPWGHRAADVLAQSTHTARALVYASPPEPHAALREDEDHPDCKTAREVELYDALMGVASYLAANVKGFRTATQGGSRVYPSTCRALRLEAQEAGSRSSSACEDK